MARNEKLNEKMKEASRQKILSAALKLFAERGPAATKIGDVALEAGVSHGLLYHYFNSKDQIFTELISTAFDKLIEASENLKSMSISAGEKIEMAMRTLINNIEEDNVSVNYHLLVAKASSSERVPGKVKKILKEKSAIPYKLIADIFRDGQESGEFNKFPAEELALMFWTTIKGLAMQKAFAGKAYRSPNPDIIMRMFT